MNTRILGLELGLMKAAATENKPPLKPFYSKALPVTKKITQPVVQPKASDKETKPTAAPSPKKFPHFQNEEGLNDRAGYNYKK